MWRHFHVCGWVLSCDKHSPILAFGHLGVLWPMSVLQPQHILCVFILRSFCKPHFLKWSLKVESCHSNSLSHVYPTRPMILCKYGWGGVYKILEIHIASQVKILSVKNTAWEETLLLIGSDLFIQYITKKEYLERCDIS